MTKVIQSYVHFKDKTFFVSTIERYFDIWGQPEPIKGFETLVWDYDYEKKERGELIGSGDGINDHLEICKSLHNTGKIPQGE